MAAAGHSHRCTLNAEAVSFLGLRQLGCPVSLPCATPTAMSLFAPQSTRHKSPLLYVRHAVICGSEAAVAGVHGAGERQIMPLEPAGVFRGRLKSNVDSVCFS